MISTRRKKLARNKKLFIFSLQDTSPDASLNIFKRLYKRFYYLRLKLNLKNLKN